MVNKIFVSLFLVLGLAGSCSAEDRIFVTSQAFSDGDMMPVKYRGDNENISPPIQWSGLPAGTRSIALVCDDPDAPSGAWTHWVVFDMPAMVNSIPEGMPPTDILPNGGKQALNDFGRPGYYGPTPPSGTHRYYFTVYALDKELGVAAGVDKNAVLNAMEGHILARGKVMARASSR